MFSSFRDALVWPVLAIYKRPGQKHSAEEPIAHLDRLFPVGYRVLSAPSLSSRVIGAVYRERSRGIDGLESVERYAR